jgi:hypothetical protein
MKVKNITCNQLDTCIAIVNKTHNYNLIYNRKPKQIGNYLHFTIRSVRSGIPGARTSASGRNLVSASWHAHGYLFDTILTQHPEAIIKTRIGCRDIRIHNGQIIGNWHDWNVGSPFNSTRISELSIRGAN